MAEKHSGQRSSNRSPWYAWRWLAAGLIAVYLLVYMPMPFVIYTAGSAEAVKPMVDVPGGDPQEEGVFMMTTVRRMNANLFMLGWNMFNDDAEYSRKEDALQGRTEEEYQTEQVFNMMGSQSNAMLAAYNKLNIPYQIVTEGIYVIRNIPEVAKNEFQTNDRVVSVEGHPIKKITDLTDLIKTYKAGDTLKAVVERNGEMVDVSATLVTFASSADPTKIQTGFGTVYGEKKEVVPDDASKKITFKESDIGGPSAGLMFTLELINQLTPGDLTRGQRIAGTGVISPDGTVGVIGGVQHKVVAADREGAVMFLVPEGNYAEAKEKVDKMDTEMKLVPVATLDDALKALETLDTK
ncbi:YlbL family protein [Paenibacillus marinisediminis]